MSSGRSIRGRASSSGGRSRGRSINISPEMENAQHSPHVEGSSHRSEHEGSASPFISCNMPMMDLPFGVDPIDNKTWIYPENDSFSPVVNAVREITHVIHSKYEYPMYNWKTTPIPVREMWFKEWAKSFKWLPQHDHQIKKNWNHKCSERLRGIMAKVRSQDVPKGKKPVWIPEEVMEQLIQIWNQQEFKDRQQAARDNRSSLVGGMAHTGGSIPAAEHMRRLRVEKGKEPSLYDVFERMHKKPGTDEFIDQRSADFCEAFNRLKSIRFPPTIIDDEVVEYELSPDEETALWLEIVGGKNVKGRIFGVGSVAGLIGGPSSSQAAQPDMSWFNPTFQQELERRIAVLTEEVGEAREARQRAEEAMQKAEEALKESQETNNILRQTNESLHGMVSRHERMLQRLLRDRGEDDDDS